MVRRAFSFLLFLGLILMLYIPVSAVTTEGHSVSLNTGVAELSHKTNSGITLPVGTVTKVTNIQRNVLINQKFDGPWQETCIDGTILYCDSGAEIKIAEPYSYSDNGSMYEFRFYFGSSKPAEIGKYSGVELPNSIDTSGYSAAQVERVTGDICLVEYQDYEIDDAGNIASLSTSFEDTYRLPNGTYYVEMIGTEAQKDDSKGSASVRSYPSAQFVVVVGETSSASITSAFSDVPADAYYSEAVQWAIENDITTGTSATTFSPDNTCTRGEIITFLWRAAKSPSPAGTVSVSDVPDGQYYTDAVLWAAENKLFNGSSFSPSDPCTRAMAVDFMWKYAGSPMVNAETPFTDVSSNNAQAVAWALENGVTTGTGDTTFSPNTACTRGQIVTLLYRDLDD